MFFIESQRGHDSSPFACHLVFYINTKHLNSKQQLCPSALCAGTCRVAKRQGEGHECQNLSLTTEVANATLVCYLVKMAKIMKITGIFL